ncbi:hypothetical protein QBC46DRAFT_441738 [Diplogelasinospora grovesii]|uniref:C2H2-type domain-containing protein n=1 Tax=Diplogelasinospora grovesii TaxID=303347 RepID=A0AAN6S2W5_9PEZI|nr:hypothetical protein QBC46DRAFT_441738 [Diplogelasinospora grovesii]
MGLTTILRGFKVPIAVLDRFLKSNGVEETWGFPPSLLPIPGSNGSPMDPQSAFLRAKLAAAGDTNSLARIFVPHRQGQARSTHAYVAYTYVMVFGQRKINLAADLPDRAPPGFAELRREILGFAEEGEPGEEALLQVAGMQGGEGEDPASLLFVVLTDEREFPLARPFMRESDLHCDHCAAVFEDWINLQYHRRDTHGVEMTGFTFLPNDL